ncbi:MAG: hypothetical protein RR734_03275 [Bacilli bacterium]
MKELFKKFLFYPMAFVGVFTVLTNFGTPVQTLLDSVEQAAATEKKPMQLSNNNESQITDEWDFSNVIDSITYFLNLYPEKSENEIATEEWKNYIEGIYFNYKEKQII